MSAPVGAPAATALPALRDPGTTGSAKLPAIHSAHGRQLPALSHPGHGLAAPLQPERDDGTAREVEKSTAAAAGAGPHSNSNTTTGADAGAARAAPWEQRPLGSHSAASSTSASTTAAASSDAAAAAAAPKNTTAETPEERKEPPHGTDDASGDIILPSGTAQVVDSASEAGDSDSDNAGAGDDEAKDTTGDELTARPSHQAVPPALLKRFSSQCLRASVWPSCLDLTPRGGFSALGQGQRVLNDVLVSKRLRVRCCAWNLHAKVRMLCVCVCPCVCVCVCVCAFSFLLCARRGSTRLQLAHPWRVLILQSPPDDLSTLFPPGKFHLYVIASSECVHSIAASVVMRDKTKWEVRAPFATQAAASRGRGVSQLTWCGGVVVVCVPACMCLRDGSGCGPQNHWTWLHQGAEPRAPGHPPHGVCPRRHPAPHLRHPLGCSAMRRGQHPW